MTVMGAIPNCVKVLEDVLNGLASDYRSSQPGEGDKEVQLLIPQPFMGTIIGTGGTKIKDLRMRTKCNIKIFSDPMPGSNERSIQLVGSQSQISECVEHFLDDIGKKEPREPIYLYEPANQFGGGGGGPPDMGGGGFSPFRGRGGGRGGPPPFRGGRGAGRGGRGGGDTGGTWRGGRGGGRGSPGGGPSGNMRGGGRGSFNGSGNGGYQFGGGSRPPAPSQYPGQAQASNSVGYGSSSQPSVGYSAQQPPAAVPGVPSAPNLGAHPLGITPPSSYPPTQPPPAGAPVQYPHQGPPPSQGFSASQMQTPPTGGTAGGNSQQVTIPGEYTDAILGANGANLQHIKSQSSCDISLEPPKPGVNERVITIMGSASGIQYAQQLMQSSVRQHHPNI